MMLPSASTTLNTALVEPSDDRPRNAVPTAPVLSAPGRSCVGRRGVRLPAKTPPAIGFGAPANGMPAGSRIVDVPIPSSRWGGLAAKGGRRGLLIDRRRGLLTRVICPVTADGLFTPFLNGGLWALKSCTRPPRIEAWPPLEA